MTSSVSGLTDRLRRRLEDERREIEELTASELERQTAENDTLRRQVERLSGQVTCLTECYRTFAAMPRGGLR